MSVKNLEDGRDYDNWILHTPNMWILAAFAINHHHHQTNTLSKTSSAAQKEDRAAIDLGEHLLLASFREVVGR
eukprot:3379356-Amphidinium_carterae.1